MFLTFSIISNKTALGVIAVHIFDVTEAVSEHFYKDINKNEGGRNDDDQDNEEVANEELLGSTESDEPNESDQKNNFNIEIKAHENPIKLLALSRDGTKLATCFLLFLNNFLKQN